MTVYERCERCDDFAEFTDYCEGIGVVCKDCSYEIRHKIPLHKKSPGEQVRKSVLNAGFTQEDFKE